MIRAILFDLGNTLLEYEAHPSREIFHAAVRAVRDHLCRQGRALPDAETFVAAFDASFAAELRRAGATTDRAVVNALQTVLAIQDLAMAPLNLPEMLAPCYEAIAQQVVVYPDTLPTLIELKQSGLRLGLVANTFWPKEFHLRDLARFELLALFDGLWFSSDAPEAPPHAGIFERALAGLDAAAEEAVFVSDDPTQDIRRAQAAGIRSVLKFHPLQAKVPRDVRPDARIDALNQIPALVEQWNPAIA